MKTHKYNSIYRRLAITAIASVVLGTGIISSVQAETIGMDRRTDRRDTRQDCRQDEGLVGKDKRDCKQDERQDDRDDRQERRDRHDND